MATPTVTPETDTAPITDAEVDAASQGDIDAEFGRMLSNQVDDVRRPSFETLDDPRAPWTRRDMLVAGSFFVLSAAMLVLIVMAAFSH